MEEGKHNTFQEMVLEVQMNAIVFVVGFLLEKALKDHVGAPQLQNIVGPLYLRNKR